MMPLGHMKPTTVGELLHWSYTNLAMAHSAITANAESYGRTQFMIRARLYKGLNAGTMSIGPPVQKMRPSGVDYAGILNVSPRCNMAQHMRAFLAAMATTAFQ